MSELPQFDLVIKNVRVVRPCRQAVDLLDLGIKEGKFARIAPEISRRRRSRGRRRQSFVRLSRHR